MFTKVKTREDSTIYFLLLPKDQNLNSIKDSISKIFNIENIDKKNYKVLGPIDFINDNSIVYHLEVLPGGVFRNYNPEISTPSFNSPTAALKSACFSTGIHFAATPDDFIIVIVETNE